MSADGYCGFLEEWLDTTQDEHKAMRHWAADTERVDLDAPRSGRLQVHADSVLITEMITASNNS